MTTQFFNDSIFWIEVEKINPNPYQPRREFDDAKLKDLSESIRMYGVLQPLVVTRKESTKADGGIVVEYELIAGERRLRASKLAGLQQVPAIIRSGQEDARVKLELAIIENLQREDLNAVDRARSFDRLVKEFSLKHSQIAEKVGKSREYVSNTLRILALPEEMLNALSAGKISDGHTRPLLMLSDRPEEQMTLFKEIVFRKISVREAERIARRIAMDKIRKKDLDADLAEMERKLADSLGTRVHIEKRDKGGKVTIDYFTNEDLQMLMDILKNGKLSPAYGDMMKGLNNSTVPVAAAVADVVAAAEAGVAVTPVSADSSAQMINPAADEQEAEQGSAKETMDDRSKDEVTADENSEDLYSIKNFSL